MTLKNFPSKFSRSFCSFKSACELRSGDWVPPKVSIDIPEDAYGLDLGKYAFRLREPRHPRSFSDKEKYEICARFLGSARSIGSVEEAKKRIYLISCDGLGFGAYCNKETALELRAKDGVTLKMTDYFMEDRAKDSRTRPMKI